MFVISSNIFTWWHELVLNRYDKKDIGDKRSPVQRLNYHIWIVRDIQSTQFTIDNDEARDDRFYDIIICDIDILWHWYFMTLMFYDVDILWHCCFHDVDVLGRCYFMTLICYDIDISWRWCFITLLFYDGDILWRWCFMTLILYDIDVLWHCNLDMVLT